MVLVVVESVVVGRADAESDARVVVAVVDAAGKEMTET